MLSKKINSTLTLLTLLGFSVVAWAQNFKPTVTCPLASSLVAGAVNPNNPVPNYSNWNYDLLGKDVPKTIVQPVQFYGFFNMVLADQIDSEDQSDTNPMCCYKNGDGTVFTLNYNYNYNDNLALNILSGSWQFAAPLTSKNKLKATNHAVAQCLSANSSYNPSESLSNYDAYNYCTFSETNCQLFQWNMEAN